MADGFFKDAIKLAKKHGSNAIKSHTLKDAGGKTDDFFNVAKNLAKKDPINNAQDSINIAQGVLGGIGATIKNMGEGIGADPIAALSAAHRTKEGALNYGAIAGSYMGVTGAARIAGGGGIYRDKHGKANLIGVPFI